MNDRKPNDPNPDAPEQFRAALARTQSRRVVVPPTLDEAVMRAAREHLKSASNKAPDRPRPAVAAHSLWEELCAGIAALRGGRHLAAFAAVMVTMVAAGSLVWLTVHPRAAARLEDLNGDGQVDMLDAFALAREIQQGQTPHSQLDLNGDGVVDERDVQVLAARAVRLEKGERS